jgi:hypothetical protein
MTISQVQRQLNPWRLAASAASWHVTSQHRARRNALVASTALMQRRRELDDVEAFLAGHAARHEAVRTLGATVPSHRAATRSA